MGVRIPRPVQNSPARVTISAPSCPEMTYQLLLDSQARIRATAGRVPPSLAGINCGDCVDEWLVDAEQPADAISRRLSSLRAGCAGLYMTVQPVRNVGSHFAARLSPAEDGRAINMELQSASTRGSARKDRIGDWGHFMAALEEAANARASVVAACVDIDRLRRINIAYGHCCGDAVRAEVGRRLIGLVESRDTVASLGGDEFGILLQGIDSHDRSVVLARALTQAMREPIVVDGLELFVTVSAGFSNPRIASPAAPEAPLQAAAGGLAEARLQGRRGLIIGDRGGSRRECEALTMETALRGALQRGEFGLCYQPVVALDSGDLRGVEALLRWHHPTFGVVSPDVFVPVLEETGLIEHVGAWVVRRACHEVRGVSSNNGVPLSVAVNVSAQQLHQPEFASIIRAALLASGQPPERLTLEITEHLLMERSRVVTTTLRRLRAMGVRLAVDDFGTGYSSLAYLRRLPVQTLKVDRTFVRGVDAGESGQSILHAILTMAEGLGLETVVEGVETASEAAFLATWPGLLAQGFWYGRPMELQGLRANRRIRLAG